MLRVPDFPQAFGGAKGIRNRNPATADDRNIGAQEQLNPWCPSGTGNIG
jgi:hypothetical protein